MVISVFLTARRTDTNTGGTQSRRDAAAPRHPTRPLSAGPAPPRPGTATVPRRPCTAPHSRASTLPIAHNRHRHTPSGEHPQAQQTTPAETCACMLQKGLGRHSTQSTRSISPEPLRPKIPDLPHAAGRRAHRGAPSSSTREEVHAPALDNGVDDELPTVGLAHEVE